jgi:hypothetical protein
LKIGEVGKMIGSDSARLHGEGIGQQILQRIEIGRGITLHKQKSTTSTDFPMSFARTGFRSFPSRQGIVNQMKP